jgi:uncharacterized protein YdaU (DUF1376 family)
MSAPWMPLYIADYLADTMHLTTVEHGAYMLLIMNYWRHGCLPDDDLKLARIVRLSPKEWGRIRDNVKALFQDGWRHKRIDSELEKSARKSDARAEAGSRGGFSKSLKNKGRVVANASDLLEQKSDFALASSSQPQSDSSSLRSDETRESAKAVDAEFDGTFWPAYPHKVGKPDAKRAFARARKSADLSEIMGGLNFYVRSKPPDRSWLNPSTFLNQERFRDQPANLPQSRAPPDRPKSMTEIGLELIRENHEQRNRNIQAAGVTIDASPVAGSGGTCADGLFERDRMDWPEADHPGAFGPDRSPARVARQAG